MLVNRFPHVYPPDISNDISESYQMPPSLNISKTKTTITLERFVPCNCSDGPCERGLMTKYQIILDEKDLKDISSLLGARYELVFLSPSS